MEQSEAKLILGMLDDITDGRLTNYQLVRDAVSCPSFDNCPKYL